MRGRDSRGVWDGHAHTGLFNVDNKRGPAVSSGKAAQCQAAAWMGGEFGGKWIHLYAWLSPFTVN